MGEHSEAAKIIIKGIEENERLRKLDTESKEAIIKLAEKNWVERHPFWFGIIMLIIGAIASRIAEVLFPLHNHT